MSKYNFYICKNRDKRCDKKCEHYYSHEIMQSCALKIYCFCKKNKKLFMLKGEIHV